MGEVLDLNSSINQESQFVDIPEGEYDAAIDHTEIDRCQWANEYNGQQMLVVYVNIPTPDGEGQLRDSIVLNTDFEWKLSQLFLGTGQKKHGEPIPNLGKAINDLPGMPVREKWSKKKAKETRPEHSTLTLAATLKRKLNLRIPAGKADSDEHRCSAPPVSEGSF